MMNKSELGKIIGAATMLYFAIAFSGGLQAAMIKGQFSLIQDEGEDLGIKQGDLVASVNFTAEDTFTLNDDDLSIFNVTRLQVIDRTPDLNLDNSVDGSPDGISLIGNFLYDADSSAADATSELHPATHALHALYNPANANAFVGISGAIREHNSEFYGTISIHCKRNFLINIYRCHF